MNDSGCIPGRIAGCFLAAALSMGGAYGSDVAPAPEFDPWYTRHDAEALAGPEDYPARSYTAATFLQRLVEIANGPELKQSDLEREFGLQFVRLRGRGGHTAGARGRFPLGNALSSYEEYNDAAGGTVAMIHLDLRDRSPRPDSLVAWSDPKLCVDVRELVARLGRGWHRNVQYDGPRLQRVRYSRLQPGRLRIVDVVPDMPGPGQCLRRISLTYLPGGTPPALDPARQGFPRDQSAAMLDESVRQLLDGILRLYREEGLFSDRAKTLRALGVTRTVRRWSDVRPAAGRHRSYVDRFAAEGIFSRPGWTGEYAYTGEAARPDTWHALLTISVEPAQQCLNSRAMEGYLDLDLDPGNRQLVHPAPEQLFRHEVAGAQPYAPPLSARTPQLSIAISRGCVSRVQLAQIFRFEEVSDALSHDQ